MIHNSKDKTMGEIIDNKPKETNDWFLQILVNLVNEGSENISIGVTLLSHGFLISGQLVGGVEYFKGLADEIASGLFSNPENGEVVRNSVVQLANNVYNKTEDSEKPSSPSYIHLKHAKLYHPGSNPIPTNRGLWWRGRISEISGFSLGNLEISE